MQSAELREIDPEEYIRDAVTVIAGKKELRFVLTCEHASFKVPPPWGNLGLEEGRLRDHIGWDIGAAEVTLELAEILGAPACLAGYSRLFVECNRMPGAVDFIAERSDGVTVPGNRDISEAERELRRKIAYDPFHQALEELLESRAPGAPEPVIVSIHSFTPEMSGQKRPWPIGVLWKGPDRLPRAIAKALSDQGIDPVGLNQPYDPAVCETMTIDHHALSRGLPHVVFEIRNDLIRTGNNARTWASRIAGSLIAVMGKAEDE